MWVLCLVGLMTVFLPSSFEVMFASANAILRGTVL
jgi:hypothetical protein